MGGSTFSNKWGWGTQCTGKQWHTFINNNSGCIFSHQWQYLYLMMVSQLTSFVVGKRFMALSGSGVQWVSMFVHSFLFLTLKLIETHYIKAYFTTTTPLLSILTRHPLIKICIPMSRLTLMYSPTFMKWGKEDSGLCCSPCPVDVFVNAWFVSSNEHFL